MQVQCKGCLKYEKSEDLDHPKEAFTTLEGEKDVFALFE